MSLQAIVGPPNSGREGEILRALHESRSDSPVLVVPTVDDAARFERALCGGSGSTPGATLGVSIRTFASLFADAARSAGVSLPPPLSPPQRLALLRAAIGAAKLRLLLRSSARPGFAPALDSLIGELQAGLIEPSELAGAAEALEDGAYELELAALYDAYGRLRDDAGRSDAGLQAAATIQALRESPATWGGRPVFVYGFDDLTRAQLELLAALAEATSVVVAVNYADRDALAARAGLLADLRTRYGAVVDRELAHDPTHTESLSLRRLDAALFEPGAEPAERDDGVELLECAGELGEAEAIGQRIAELLAIGEPADSIAVVARDVTRRGPLLGRVLERFEIPVAVEARASLAHTAVGRGVIALCRALDADDPASLLAHLRADPGSPPGAADWLERRLRREDPGSIDAAIEGWRAPPPHLALLRAAAPGADAMRALATIAHELAEAPHAERAPLAGHALAADARPPFDPVEQRAAVAIAELVGELAEVGELPGCRAPGLLDAAEAIESATVALWRGPADGRVRVLDPYRIRAGRARHLFCAGLQEGEFPRRSPGDPLLGDERRRRLGIEALVRRDPYEEERYLFHACVSRPTQRLYLSWQDADDNGAPAARSPFVDEVLDLIGADRDATAEALTRRRGVARVTFDLSAAPTERELERARALAGARVAEEKPRHLHVPEVLAELDARELLSASTLEQWLECPYRWFAEHELAPQRLDPESDALRLGSVAHDALEALYREPPGDDRIPRPSDLDRWRARLATVLELAAEENGMRPAAPRDAIALARLRAQIESFLREESALDTELRPRPELLEAGFGMEDEAGGPPALDLGAAKLRGRIDRIDLAADGHRALVRDYKTSTEVHGRAGWESRGKLQLQLYILAARERLGLEPVGGLYTALGARDDRRPRGMTIKADPALDGLELKGRDPCDAEAFEAELERSRELASANAAAMRAGRIDRDPIGGRCPTYCSFQPICRLERALGLEDQNGAADGNGGADS